jgi:hypothetical protein
MDVQCDSFNTDVTDVIVNLRTAHASGTTRASHIVHLVFYFVISDVPRISLISFAFFSFYATEGATKLLLRNPLLH